jgi:hypothetical protein
MFRVGQLKDVNNERVNINLVKHETSSYKNGKKVSFEEYNTLSFDVCGNNYSLCFDMNCKLEELLKIPMNKTIDFKEYVYSGKCLLNIKEYNGIEPEFNIKITRYLDNRFIIFLTFYTEYSYDEKNYGGIVEFTFNLDDYMN